MRSRAASSTRWWIFAQVTAAANAATGMLRKKIARQLTSSVSTPPIRGPRALPSPATPRIRPPAKAARDGGTAAKVMPRIAGHMRPPPTPIPTRIAISCSAFCASPPSREKAAKIAVPMKKTLRRPNMSASRPPVTSTIPKVRA